MKKNYILGGGIAGLIFAYYNEDFTIISETIGGQFNHYFPMGPRFLEDNEYSRKFLTELEFPLTMKKIKIGYKQGDTIKETCDKEFMQKYYNKSRGEEGMINTTIMNGNKKEMDILIVDFKKLIELLTEKIGQKRIKYHKVNKISLYDKKIYTKGKKKVFDYDKLVSTIPLPVFFKLAGKEKKGYESKDMTYVLLKPNFTDLKDFSFVYYCGEQTYHRLTNDKQGIVADILGWKTITEILEEFPDAVDIKHAPNIQIINGETIDKLDEDVLFIGRYGTWNREWKTEKVIEEAIKYGQ